MVLKKQVYKNGGTWLNNHKTSFGGNNSTCQITFVQRVDSASQCRGWQYFILINKQTNKMEKSNLTTADATASNSNNAVKTDANVLQKAVLAQTSAKAKRLLAEADKKAKTAKAGTSKPKAESKPEKGGKKAEADKKAPKRGGQSIASKMDEIIKAGGTWAELVDKVQKASNSMGGTMKHSIATIKAHIKFRTVTQKAKNPNYLGNKKVNDAGIGVAIKKAKKAA